MFQYCPKCASDRIVLERNRFNCPLCGFVYFHNTAAATGCVIDRGEDVALLVRANEPALGLLDLPGGFVDPGEGLLEGLTRELREELGWVPPIPEGKCRETAFADVFKIFSSFHNVYHYKGIDYNTCDMYFYVIAYGLTPQDLHLEKAEISEVRFLKREEINFDDFAFESTKKALKAFLAAP